tara:strand:+ start:290 stop:883 length:594 start_codon:yes stop_codon:yes gene_type:complete
MFDNGKFQPIFMCSYWTCNLDVDNEQINKDVLKRSSMKLDDTPGNTFQEDSYYPETQACDDLINKVDDAIQKNINKYFKTYNKWAHILDVNESTMIHSHDSVGTPGHLSWVYYSKTEENAGNIVWQTTIHNKMITWEETPEVGKLIVFPNWMPHFTKKNISGETRISISGNSKPDEKDFPKVGENPENLFNIIGLVT